MNYFFIVSIATLLFSCLEATSPQSEDSFGKSEKNLTIKEDKPSKETNDFFKLSGKRKKQRSFPSERTHKYDLTICSIFQNEGRFLKEWIEYHRLVGVQHFVLLNDKSTDNYLDILTPYINQGIVDLYEVDSGGNFNNGYQVGAIGFMLTLTKETSHWVALIDIDELIVPMEKDNIVDYLKEYETYAQIYIRWEPFGTSYVQKIPKGKLMVECLTKRMKYIPGLDLLGKAIVKPKLIQYPNIHGCYPYPPNSSYDVGYLEFPKIKIFHYWTRDIDFLVNVKRPRREALEGPWSQEKLNNYIYMYNDIDDYTMSRFIPELRQRVFGEN